MHSAILKGLSGGMAIAFDGCWEVRWAPSANSASGAVGPHFLIWNSLKVVNIHFAAWERVRTAPTLKLSFLHAARGSPSEVASLGHRVPWHYRRRRIMSLFQYRWRTPTATAKKSQTRRPGQGRTRAKAARLSPLVTPHRLCSGLPPTAKNTPEVQLVS